MNAANETLALLQTAIVEARIEQATKALQPKPTCDVVDPGTITINGKSFPVMVHSWGYDQTNIDFYAVVRETDRTVVLQRIGSRLVEHNSYMSSKVVPAPEFLSTQTTRKRKVNAPGEPLSCAGVNDCGWTRQWDGKPETATSYH